MGASDRPTEVAEPVVQSFDIAASGNTSDLGLVGAGLNRLLEPFAERRVAVLPREANVADTRYGDVATRVRLAETESRRYETESANWTELVSASLVILYKEGIPTSEEAPWRLDRQQRPPRPGWTYHLPVHTAWTPSLSC